MTCEACVQAAAKVSHLFYGGCRGCAARSIVRGPHFRRVQQAGMQDRQYRATLAQLGVTHEEVREQAAADMLLKVQQRRERARGRPDGATTDAPALCTAASAPAVSSAAPTSVPASPPPQAAATP